MADSKDFISWTYDPAINRERADLILSVLSFIGDGVSNRHGSGPGVVEFASYENNIKAALYERMTTPMTRPLPKRAWVDAGDTVDLFTAAFNRQHSWYGRSQGVAAFNLAGRLTDPVMERLAASQSPEVDESAGLAGAFEMVCSNLARYTTRVSLIFTVSHLLNLKVEPQGVGAVLDRLHSRKSELQRDLMVFGGLLGGEHLSRAIKTVAPQTCYSDSGTTNFTIMHHLQRDSYYPGHWRTADEEKFRADIKAAFEAL